MDDKRSGDGWWVVTFVIGVLALIVGVVGVAIASGKSNTSSAAGAGAAGGGVTEVDVTLADISVSPNMIEVPSGQAVTLHVTNEGAMAHDFKVEGTTGTKMLEPGESQDIVIGPFTADAKVWCTVPGHKEAGMLMAVHVLGAAPVAPSGGGADAVAALATSGNAVIDAAAMPDADWTGRDPVLPAKQSGTVHEITLDATETLIEVAPGAVSYTHLTLPTSDLV